MRRREFFTLAGAAIMWPLASAGQPKPMPVIGILDPDVSFIFDAFVEGMRDLGYVEGRNIAYVRKLVPAGSSLSRARLDWTSGWQQDGWSCLKMHGVPGNLMRDRSPYRHDRQAAISPFAASV